MVDPRKAKIVKRNESNGSSTEVDCAVSVRGVLAKNYICLELWWCLIMMNKTVWYHCQHWQTAALKPVSSSLVPLLPSCYFPWVAWGVLWVLTRLFYSVAPHCLAMVNAAVLTAHGGESASATRLERFWQHLKQTHLSFLSLFAFHIWLICRSSLYCHT